MSDLEWTGERYIPTVSGEIEFEHYHRYLLARKYASGKKVLDIACGEGYGSQLLSSVSEFVYAVDIDPATIKNARSKYTDKNIEFIAGSCSKIPLGDNSVDLVVSFETIEHHDQHEEMISEINRVLKDDGLLIISSPDKKEYSDLTGNVNEYHVKELYQDEFVELLKHSFSYVTLMGQIIKYGSIIAPVDQSKSIEFYPFDSQENNEEKYNPLYFIALASNRINHGAFSIYSAPLEKSEYASRCKELFKGYWDEIEELKGKNEQYELIEDENNAIKNELESTQINNKELNLNNKSLQKALTETQEQKEKLASQVSEYDKLVTMITQSKSWRLTSPMRGLARRSKNIKNQTKTACLELIRRTYHRLPLNLFWKNNLKSFFFRLAPRLFTDTLSYQLWLRMQEMKRKPLTTVSDVNLKTSLEPEDLPVIEKFQDPDVSIIIPVYGQIEYTVRCLNSLQNTKNNTSYEVIVIDDCSPDNSLEVLREIKGIILLENKENLGFIKSCNKAARSASGQYVYLLNNDTEVTNHWLDELIETFQLIPAAGLVGSKLLYPDGKLQEAGGLVWNNGSGWNVGKLEDAGKPEYNYLRDVDYCSGASIMIPKTLWQRLEGFDEYYLPAYGEDSDIAFRIRELGYRVLYQPLSEVIHYEGITSGTDVTDGVKSYQVENAKKLFSRWKDVLQTYRDPGVAPHLEKDRNIKYRILVLDHCTPMPDHDAGSITALNIMRVLQSLSFKVTFIPEDNFLYLEDYTRALQKEGIECLYLPYLHSVKEHLELYGKDYDAVLMFRMGVAHKNIDIVRSFCPNVPIIFHNSDLHYLREQRQAELEDSDYLRKQALKTKERELDVIRRVDATIVHSTAEEDILQKEDIRNVHVFPWVLETKPSNTEYAGRKDIVFVGGYQHTPNVDAVKYFVQDIFPLIKKKIPDIEFHVVGSNAPSSIRELEGNGVIIKGFVEDLEPVFENCRLSIAPLRFGAGIKGKIGFSMGHGLPCVTTTLGAEGMGLIHGENILIADEPSAFAEEVVNLYNNQELWDRLSSESLKYVSENYSFKKGISIMSDLFKSIDL